MDQIRLAILAILVIRIDHCYYCISVSLKKKSPLGCPKGILTSCNFVNYSENTDFFHAYISCYIRTLFKTTFEKNMTKKLFFAFGISLQKKMFFHGNYLTEMKEDFRMNNKKKAFFSFENRKRICREIVVC